MRLTLHLVAPIASALLLSCSGTESTSAVHTEPPAAPDAASPFDGATDSAPHEAGGSGAWRFAVVGDTHVQIASASAFTEMIPSIVQDAPRLVLVPGDIVQGGLGSSQLQLRNELEAFQSAVQPLRSQGIDVYAVRGNHEADAQGSTEEWLKAFSGAFAFPANGPAGEVGLTYSFEHGNALFVALDQYVSLHRVNQGWLDQQLATTTMPHVFVFGHEPAFKVFHADCLGSFSTDRDAFWRSLAGAGARAYFTGHDHFLDVARIEDGDGAPDNDVYQLLVGTGGGVFPPKPGQYNGDNSTYVPVGIVHEVQYGYLLVEVGGQGQDDRAVKITWKHRTVGDAAEVSYTAASDVLAYSSARP